MPTVPVLISTLALLVSIASFVLTLYFQHYRRRMVVHSSFRPYLEPGTESDGELVPGAWAYATEYFAHFTVSNDGNRDVIVTGVGFQIWRRDEAKNVTWAYCGSAPLEKPVKVAAGEIEVIKISCNFANALRAAHAEIHGGAPFVKYKARASIAFIGPQNRSIEQTLDGEMIQRADETQLVFPQGGLFPRIALTLPMAPK